MTDRHDRPPRPPTRLHPGTDEWGDDLADPLGNELWDTPKGPGGLVPHNLDDAPEWAADSRCIGRADFIGYERMLCPNEASGDDGLCDECRDRGWDVLCTHCGLNQRSYWSELTGSREPICRTCYQWLRRNRTKYSDTSELLARLAEVIAHRRARAGRSPSPER